VLGSPKQRALLAYLLLHANEVVARGRLIEELWGDAAPATVNVVLNGYVSKLRRLLAEGTHDELLATRAPGYVLRVPADQIDAHRFEALLRQGREELAQGDAGQAAATLREALSLWRGRPLADLAYEQFAQSEIRRLEELRLAAVEERIDADLALGRHDELVAELETLVAEHAYRERLHAQLMLALYRSGRQAEALEAYRRARRAFADELGIDPGPRLSELERGVLRQDASLDAPLLAQVEQKGSRRAEVPRSTRWRVALAAGFILALSIAAGLVAELRDTQRRPPEPPVLKGDSVAVVDLGRTAVVAEVRVGARPSGIAVGEGSVWVGNRDDDTLLRIDPESRTVVRTIGLAAEPRDIAVASGSVWVATNTGSVLRVEPTSHEVVRTIALARQREMCCPPKLAVGGAAVWVSHRGQLTRIDPATNRVVTVRKAGVASIAYGQNALWVLTGEGQIERLEPNTNRILDTISREPVGAAEFGGGIAAGAGAVWTATYLERALWKIDPVTGDFVGKVALGRQAGHAVGRRPVGVAFGDEAVWIVTTDGSLLRVDPKSEKVVREIRLGVYAAQAPAGDIEAQGGWAPIAAGEGALWLPVTP
jgi:YVTN family beta-propeller protein